MGQILSQGGGVCEFDWTGAVFRDGADVAEKRKKLLPGVTKDFLYHCGHMLSAFRREIYRSLGLVKGREIVKSALDDYGAIFGPEKTAALEKESRGNFSPD
jgi:hypothetical protein